MPARSLDALPRISSIDNPLVKRIARLVGSTRERRTSRRMVLDGIHLASAFARTGVPVDLLAISEHALDDPEIRALLASCKAHERVVLSQRVFEKLSPVITPAGVLCVAPIPAQTEMPNEASDIVVLDRIQDAGNVGAILRTVAAVGVPLVIISRGTADPWSPRVLRAAMGAHFALNVHEVSDLHERLTTFNGRILATAGSGEATLYDLDLKAPTIWVFGNEGSGLSPEIVATAATTVCIPINAGVESLNVAAAAAICLFEQARQRRRRHA